MRVLVGVFDAILVHEIVRGVAALHELRNVVPPLGANAILFAVVFPDTDSAERLLDHVGSRDSLFEVVVGVGGAVAARCWCRGCSTRSRRLCRGN